MTQSLKQKWVSERLFSHKGSLSGIVTRLNQIAIAPSTLPYESSRLYEAARIIKNISMEMDKTQSWKQFQERKG
jgi:hypothetical protein